MSGRLTVTCSFALLLKRIVLRRVKINDGEKVRTVTLAEAVIRKNIHAALQKNPFAMSNIFHLAEQAGEFVDFTEAKQVGSPIAVPEKNTSMEEFLAEFGRKVGE